MKGCALCRACCIRLMERATRSKDEVAASGLLRVNVVVLTALREGAALRGKLLLSMLGTLRCGGSSRVCCARALLCRMLINICSLTVGPERRYSGAVAVASRLPGPWSEASDSSSSGATR